MIEKVEKLTPKPHGKVHLLPHIEIGGSLLAEESASSEESDSEEDHSSKRVSLPSENIRKHKAAHLPRMQPDAAILNARKVNPGLCVPNCNVYLCIHGCFEEFHK